MRINNSIRDEYEKRLTESGEAQFYRHLLANGMIATKKYDHPEIVMLDQAEEFFSLYRRTGNDHYFVIGRLLRRAAHKIYWRMRRDVKDFPRNARFMDVVN